jgi:hypothetical protein
VRALADAAELEQDRGVAVGVRDREEAPRAGGIAVVLVTASIVVGVVARNSGKTSVVPGGDVTEPAAEPTFTQPGIGGHLEPGESFGPAETGTGCGGAAR